MTAQATVQQGNVVTPGSLTSAVRLRKSGHTALLPDPGDDPGQARQARSR